MPPAPICNVGRIWKKTIDRIPCIAYCSRYPQLILHIWEEMEIGGAQECPLSKAKALSYLHLPNSLQSHCSLPLIYFRGLDFLQGCRQISIPCSASFLNNYHFLTHRLDGLVKQAVLELREINLEENYLGKCTLYRVHYVAKYLLPTLRRTTWVSVHCTEYTTWLNISSRPWGELPG